MDGTVEHLVCLRESSHHQPLPLPGSRAQCCPIPVSFVCVLFNEKRQNQIMMGNRPASTEWQLTAGHSKHLGGAPNTVRELDWTAIHQLADFALDGVMF